MANDPLTTLIRQLNQSVFALAAVGGQLRLDGGGRAADPATASAMADALVAIGAPPLHALSAPERQQALGLIQTFFKEAEDLLTRPERPPGWVFEDPAILDGIGTASAGMVGRIAALADARPWFAAALAGPGTFLDVGTGVGGLALAVAERWPQLDVVGIDRWPPSLALAERNRRNSPCAGRVGFLHRALEELDDEARFTAAWLPTPFIAEAVVRASLARLHRALRPGGGLVAGVLPPSGGAVASSLGALRTLRNGGHPWTGAAMAALLEDAGFVDVDVPPDQVGMHFVVGRRP